ncbi:hypothetical protein [Pseudoalteromonas rubra]|uniref:Uncharacterized protein n=1 Tax=Pseudoalteromonas rubra TaxID=43658 RepID=A0A5S3WW41_9GAMM|nr:hypothetical protein [Pseudoalteromonas rubra]TMP33444.1 hypothetical protein CWB98_19980 [Pseudoalteromonas rubra]
MENNSDQASNYKDKQIERMNKFVVNGTDSLGYKIEKVLAKGDEYVIYEVAGLPIQESIRIYIDTLKEVDEEPVERVNEIKPHFDEFLSVLFKYDCDSSYKKRASNAVAMAINGKLEEAKALFEKIKSDATQEYTEKILGRFSYQSGALLLSIILILVLGLSHLNGFSQSDAKIVWDVSLAAIFSSFGGFLSISLRLKDITIDRGLNRFTYLLMGSLRAIISVVGGVLIFFVVKSNLAFGFLNSDDGGVWGVMVFCFLAGFSETLVPNTLKSLESKSQSTNKEFHRTGQ